MQSSNVNLSWISQGHTHGKWSYNQMENELHWFQGMYIFECKHKEIASDSKKDF
jgi:hypothetical protein